MVDRIVKRKKYAVVVTTYGEVEDLKVRNLWPSSRKILRVVTRQIVAIPEALMYVIADYRSAKHYMKWKRSRYHSTFLAVHRAQTKMIAEGIASAGVMPEADITVLDAYYFVPPYLDKVIADIMDEYDGIVVLPLIPVESAFSCGVACQMILDASGERVFGKLRVVSKMWKDDRLLSLTANYLFSQLGESVKSVRDWKVGLVLVIHGTLVRDSAGNPPDVFTGLDETLEFFRLMKEKVMNHPDSIFHDVRLGCINHSRGGEWMEETIGKAFESFRNEGCHGVVMFPFGFFADNSETELDSKGLLDSAGFPVTQYIRCLNDSPEFGRWLATKAAEELGALAGLQAAIENMTNTTQTPSSV
jgi:protoporphyrin/coproporphyrin ferrochelatase